jgi:hypothetical protein
MCTGGLLPGVSVAGPLRLLLTFAHCRRLECLELYADAPPRTVKQCAVTNLSLPLQNCKKIGIPRLAKEILHLLYCEIAHDWIREHPVPR